MPPEGNATGVRGAAPSARVLFPLARASLAVDQAKAEVPPNRGFWRSERLPTLGPDIRRTWRRAGAARRSTKTAARSPNRSCNSGPMNRSSHATMTSQCADPQRVGLGQQPFGPLDRPRGGVPDLDGLESRFSDQLRAHAELPAGLLDRDPGLRLAGGSSRSASGCTDSSSRSFPPRVWTGCSFRPIMVGGRR
jgi:hypothetical protein